MKFEVKKYLLILLNILIFLVIKSYSIEDTQSNINNLSCFNFKTPLSITFNSEDILDSIPTNFYKQQIVEIRFEGTPNINFEEILTKLENKDSLKHLSFIGMKISNINTILNKFKNLELLEINKCNHKPLDFNLISNKIKVLTLNESLFNVSSLKMLNELETLKLSNSINEFGRDSLTTSIRSLNKLKSLFLQNILLSDTLIISNLTYQLDFLFLDNNDLKSIIFTNPRNLTKLENVAIIENPDFDYKGFFRNYSNYFTSLKILGLININMRDIPLELFDIKSINNLEFQNNHIQKVDTLILNLTNLKGINLDDNDLERLPIEISKMNKLEFLSIRFNNFKDLSFVEKLKIWSVQTYGNPGFRKIK